MKEKQAGLLYRTHGGEKQNNETSVGRVVVE